MASSFFLFCCLCINEIPNIIIRPESFRDFYISLSPLMRDIRGLGQGVKNLRLQWIKFNHFRAWFLTFFGSYIC